MAIDRYSYPFTAIVGQEKMKLALVLNAINPSIGGVLIRGEKGTGKSTAVRALARLLPDQQGVDGCHFGCHPDDPEDWCADCRERARGGQLPVTTRRMRVVELRPQLLDRFGLCVDVEGIRDLDKRVEIVEKRAVWEDDPHKFVQQHAESEQDVRSHIAEGIATFPEVDLPREILRLIAQISIALEVDGHRSDLVCARAAQAKAAYDSAEQVKVTHVGAVAEMVFAHRVHSVPFGKGGPNLPELTARMIGQGGAAR